MTNTPKLAIAIGYIDDDLVTGAVEYMPAPSKKFTHIWKHFVAVAACMVIVFGISGTHNYLKQYVATNDIQVYYADATEDRISASDVNPAQAEKMAEANNLHNLITAQNLEWYGGCFYDFEDDIIMVGLTANITEHQKQILDIADDSSIQFYNCEYSYQYLETVYKNLDSKRFLLNAAGVERYNISIENNRINVYVFNEKSYAALYLVNELDKESGAVVFKTTSYSADTQS